MPRLAALALLLCPFWLAGVARAGLSDACQPAPVLDAACHAALARAPLDEVQSLADRWLVARHYPAVQALLQAAIARHGRLASLTQRLQDVESLQEEAAWLASRQSSASPGAPDVDSELTETRCLRLTGEEALAACQQALARRPGDVRLLTARGDHLLARGEAAAALQAYQTAQAAGPSALLEQKIATASAQQQAQSATLDQQLAALVKARQRKLISITEFRRQRSALLAQASAPPSARAITPAADIAFGRYHALVIGNNAYRHLPRLDTAVDDAKAIADVLRGQYGFNARLLLDASRADIIEALDDYRARLKEDDNLVIYYAGHGWLDRDADQGFWLPVDAREDKRTQWVSNDSVRDALRALKAKHVLVIADSCFSGTLTRSLPQQPSRDGDYLQRMASRKARQVLASGGLEPVADSGGGRHSPFAAALLAIFRSNQGVLDGSSLFADLRRPVAVNSEQTPQFADIRQTGHQGGDFLFVRRPPAAR